MTFQFIQSEQDYINFNLYYSWFESGRKRLRVGVYLYLPMLFLIITILSNGGFIFKTSDYITLGIGILCAPLIAKLYKWLLQYKAKALLKIGKNHNLIGERQVSLLNDNIKLTGRFANSEIQWNSLEKVREDDSYIYLFVATNQAIILPKRVFANQDEFNKTMELIKTKTGYNTKHKPDRA